MAYPQPLSPPIIATLIYFAASSFNGVSMVLTKGELEIRIEEPYFEKGRPLHGKALLHLPGPISARSLRVEFYLEINHGKAHDYEKALLNKKELSGQKKYEDGEEFQFELGIPASLDYDAKPVSGKANGWFVHAVLDVPLATDLNARVPVLPYRKEPQEVD